MAATTKKAKCPKCGQAFSFELLPEMTSVDCPHCEVTIEFRRKSRPKPATAEPKTPPPAAQEPSVAPFASKTPPPIVPPSTPTPPQPEAADAEPAEPSFPHKPLESLLPPTFNLGGQDSDGSPRSRQSQVILPTSDGGLQQINTNTVTIEHAGKLVTLIASTPRERARRRFIENVVSIVLAIGIIALALWILS